MVPVQSYRSLNATSKKYTHDDFTAGVCMIDLLKAPSSTSLFGRGLPTTTYLQNESYAQVFRQVIQAGGLVVPQPHDQLGEVLEKTPLRMCFELGWLYNEAISPAEVIYTFSSPLHMRYVQWMLLGNQDEAIISENSIIDFVIAVIRKFIPLNLSAQRMFGTTTQSAPEAQFQDEFYRACINHTISWRHWRILPLRMYSLLSRNGRLGI
jgi:hypothetical protein